MYELINYYKKKKTFNPIEAQQHINILTNQRQIENFDIYILYMNIFDLCSFFFLFLIIINCLHECYNKYYYYILIINKLYIENALILYISNYKKNVIYSCNSLACKMLF